MPLLAVGYSVLKYHVENYGMPAPPTSSTLCSVGIPGPTVSQRTRSLDSIIDDGDEGSGNNDYYIPTAPVFTAAISNPTDSQQQLSPPASSATSAASSQTLPSSPSYISHLEEWKMKGYGRAVQFTEGKKLGGFDHAPRFGCDVVIVTSKGAPINSFSGTGTTKKMAKNE